MLRSCLPLAMLSVALVFRLPLAYADPARDKAIAEDRRVLAGDWRFADVAGDTDPDALKKLTALLLKNMVISSDGNGAWAIRFYEKGAEKPASWAFRGTSKLDPTQQPKSLDLIENNNTTLCIYEVKADSLKICFGPQGAGERRPTDFTCPAGSGRLLLTLEREKLKPR